MKPQTIGAIALGPSGNLQGGVRFFSLNTGKIINRHKNDYTLLPMPEEVIKRVNRMARKTRAGLHFADRHNDPIIDTSDDDSTEEDYEPPDTQHDYDIEHESSESSSDKDDTDDNESLMTTPTYLMMSLSQE